jgi:hypothetical protein
MRTYYQAPIPPLHILDGAAFNTFTTFQSVTPAPGIILPANILEPGSEIRLEAAGEYSNTGTPTLGFGFFYGTAASVALAVGTGIATGSSVASCPWYAEWTGRVRSVGATGSIHGMGAWKLATSLTTFSAEQAMPVTLALRTVTINTTAATEVGIGAVWGTSSASNSVKTNRLSCTLIS